MKIKVKPLAQRNWFERMAYRLGHRKCIRGHYETVHHPAWLQMMPSGKFLIPINHPAYDSEEWVCDEREI